MYEVRFWIILDKLYQLTALPVIAEETVSSEAEKYGFFCSPEEKPPGEETESITAALVLHCY